MKRKEYRDKLHKTLHTIFKDVEDYNEQEHDGYYQHIQYTNGSYILHVPLVYLPTNVPPYVSIINMN